MIAYIPTCPAGRSCVTREQLAQNLHKKVAWVRAELQTKRIDPFCLAEHLHKGRRTQFYLPCVEEVLRQESERYPMAPEGWFTRNHLQRKLSINWRQASKLLEDFFGQSCLMRDSSNKIFRYYPVDVWKKLVQEKADTAVPMKAA